MTKQNNHAPKALSENIVTQKIGDELLIYNLETHRAMSLNSTVACVWELCDGTKNLSEIHRQAERQLKSALPEEAIVLALDELKKNKLFAETDRGSESEKTLSEMSRRAMIRRVGLATAAAIPVIMAISAPHAVHAASGSSRKPNGATCARDTECQSTCCQAVCVSIDNCF